MEPSDQQLLELLAQGWRQSDLMRELGISERSLRTRIDRLKAEFRARTVMELVVKAVRSGRI